MNTFRFGVAAVISTAAISPLAQGALVQVRDAPGGVHSNGQPNGPLLEGTHSNVLGSFSNGADGAMPMGTFALEADFGSGFQPLLTYCIEPNAEIGFGFHPDDTVGLQYETNALTSAGFTAEEETQIERLWANAFAQSMTSPLLAAAFQAILWELHEDTTVDFADGGFHLSQIDADAQDVEAQAQEWLNNTTNGTWTTSVDLIALTHPNSQNYITVVPAPGAMAMLLGAMMLGRARRRVA